MSLNIVRPLITLGCILIISLVAILMYSGAAAPKVFDKAIFCQDQSLRYPLKPLSHSRAAIITSCAIIPLLVFAILEGALYLYLQTYYSYIMTPPHDIINRVIPNWLWNMCTLMAIFYFGYFLMIYISFLGKHLLSQPRPNFIEVCQPLPNLINCSSTGYHQQNQNCTQTDTALLAEAKISFPSVVAAVLSYTTIFCIIVFQYRFIWNIGFMLKFLIQFLFFALSYNVILTRVSDYHNHWGDVLAGAFFGSLSAIIMCHYLFVPFLGCPLDTTKTVLNKC